MKNGSIWLRRSALLTLALLSSCAFGNRTADLYYPPVQDDELEKAVEAAAPLVAGPTIILAPFVDARDNTETVGEVRNGLGAYRRRRHGGRRRGVGA